MNKTNRARRNAFGKLLTQGFVLIQSIANGVTNTHVFGLPTSFLTDKELERLRKIVRLLNRDADYLRDFGNYLQRTSRETQ